MIKVNKDSRFRNISEAEVEHHLAMGWKLAEESKNKESKPKKAKKPTIETVEDPSDVVSDAVDIDNLT